MRLAWMLLALSCGAAQVLWRQPAGSAEQWTCGWTGCDGAPTAPFQFVKEQSSGTNPKIDVRDAKGRSWSVKFGAEVIPECFASRFVTAAGYLAEPTYFVASGKVEGAGKLRRARRVVKPDGTFTRARFEARGLREMEFLQDHTWAWNDNPFLGTRELGGLKIVMMLLSNWDAKDAREAEDSNNGIFRIHSILVYGVFDWGASLGGWGGALRRDQSDCAAYFRDTRDFVRAGKNHRLEWGFRGKHAEDLTNASAEDARWLLPKLASFQRRQLVDGLKASGATDRQAACWSESIEARIQQLKAAVR